MSANTGVIIADTIRPSSDLDSYATHEAKYGRGGWRTVITVAARDAIPTARRESGMIVFCLDVGRAYRLDGTVWQPVDLGGAAVDPQYTAAASLSGHHAVTLNDAGQLIYADCLTNSHAGSVLGLTTGAISSGASGPVRVSGALAEPSWTWSPRAPLFLRETGSIAQTPPAAGFVLIVGWAMSATTVFIDIKQAVFLEG